MKTVLSDDYKYKKLIADNLQKAINNMTIEISDEEYSRINTAIDTYSEAIQNVYDHLTDIAFTEEQKTRLLHQIEQLEADIKSLKKETFFVDEAGLYFTDEEGNIGAKLDSTGFSSVGAIRDLNLSIVDY